MDENTFKKILDEAIAPLREDIKELKDVQENRLLPSVTELEVTVKSCADSYKINQQNIERVDTRLTGVEEELNVEVSEDLKVPHFSVE
ncbi:hypothetical protein HYW42_05155 [Candidatus Daviesbacteria bacterium]|nr:hypothetical protein [Candidatus Daviesbacteria bacterium]